MGRQATFSYDLGNHLWDPRRTHSCIIRRIKTYKLKDNLILLDDIKYASRRCYTRDQLAVLAHAVHVPLAGTEFAVHASEQHRMQVGARVRSMVLWRYTCSLVVVAVEKLAKQLEQLILNNQAFTSLVHIEFAL